MAIQCPNCNREYDVALFQFGSRIRCSCGRTFSLKEANVRREDRDPLEELSHEIEVLKEDEKILQVRKEADRICRMILDKNFSQIDIQIAKEKFYRLCQEKFSDKIHLYDLIFEPRFQRLWEQFRKQAEQEGDLL
jgi:hypothetical protein